MILRNLYQPLFLLLALWAILLLPAESLAQNQRAGTITNGSYYLGNPAPFNQTIVPEGMYSIGNSTMIQIEVYIQNKNVATGVYTVMANYPARIASTSQTPGGILTWSAAAYQNLAAGDYKTMAVLKEGFGSPPSMPAYSTHTDSPSITIP